MKPTSLDDLTLRLSDLERRLNAATRRARRAVALAVLAIAGAVAWSTLPEARAQFGLTLVGLDSRLKAIEAKTRPISLDGNNLWISGVNVHVVDGTNNTLSDSGRGNLIIRYNVTRGGRADVRSGSHNLILGDRNNYTSSGGLIAGYSNEASGSYTSVSGGRENTASGDYSSISGGWENTASGYAASVSGGLLNKASDVTTSVSGGFNRSAPDAGNWAGGHYFSSR